MDSTYGHVKQFLSNRSSVHCTKLERRSTVMEIHSVNKLTKRVKKIRPIQVV